MRAKKLKGPNNSILMYDDNLKTDLEHMNILKKDFKNDLLTGKFQDLRYRREIIWMPG